MNLKILLQDIELTIGIIEPLRQIYFFKNVKPIEEEKTFPIFFTSSPVGSLFGRFFFALILLLLPKNFLYLGISIFMGSMVMITLKLKDKK